MSVAGALASFRRVENDRFRPKAVLHNSGFFGPSRHEPDLQRIESQFNTFAKSLTH